MAPTLVDNVHQGLFTGLGSGVSVSLPGGGSAANGDWDLISVNSDATINTPSGFTLLLSIVNNQGSYFFARQCTGGEGPSVTIQSVPAGNFDAAVQWSRWRGLGSFQGTPPSNDATVVNAGGTTTPACSTSTLGNATTFVIMAACTHNSNAANPTGFTPSAGYTFIGSGGSGAGGLNTASFGAQAYKYPAGTAAESPSFSWTNQQRDRDVYVMAFDTSSAVTINDTSSGASGATSAEILQIGVTKQDSSSSASGGSSTEQLQIGVTKQDSSGGASGGGSTEQLQIGVTLQDGSGGGAGGSSAETLLIGTVIQDSSGGAAAGSSLETVSAGGAPDVTINDFSGGASAGSSAQTVQANSEVVHDKMVMPVLLVAEACLTTEAAKLAKPPAEYQIRPGASFVAYADQTRDECCNGIGWVRPGPMWETDDFPVQRSGASKIEPANYAVTIELGIIRCLPTQSDQPGLEGQGAKPTVAQWQQATQEAMDDAAALRRVVCCLRELYHVDAVVAGQINPLQNEANCAGTTIVVTMRVPACDCFDAG